MTLECFLLLLMIVSILTGLFTEGIKKLLEESKKTYKANFLAGGVAVVLSVLVGSGYIILMDAQINSKMAVYLIALILLSVCLISGFHCVQYFSQYSYILLIHKSTSQKRSLKTGS